MGARLKEPLSFSVDRSTTGVPKYKMGGVMITWPAAGSAGAGAGGGMLMPPTVGRGLFGVRRTIRER
jgi:hypothetical protein